jgi:hypothetical protein
MKGTYERTAERLLKGKITEMMAQDRKTGEFYNPQEAFDAMMNKPEIQAVLKRLAVR